ncbi:MAG: 2-dehydropantoate 2-reductase [Asgard group archaeon]|nr:2-dehydropantoate 2-reductase [Asgard group archaeon]
MQKKFKMVHTQLRNIHTRGDILFLFMGSGSVGSLYGGLLASIGQEVILIGRKNHVKAINENSLEIQGLINKNITIPAFDVISETSRKDLKFIFFTTKAHQLEAAAIQIKEIITKNTILVSLQNGLDTENVIQDIYPENMVLRAVTSIGVCRPRPGLIDYTGLGQTLIGYKNKNEEKVAANLVSLFNQAGISAQLEPNISGAVFSKVIVNCGLNPLAALYQVKNIEVFNQIELRNLATELAREAWTVAQELDIDLKVDNPIIYMFDVIKKTGNNINSMLRDVREKRKTEIDFINGKIVELGLKLNVDVPQNQDIYKKVKALEKSYLDS